MKSDNLEVKGQRSKVKRQLCKVRRLVRPSTRGDHALAPRRCLVRRCLAPRRDNARHHAGDRAPDRQCLADGRGGSAERCRRSPRRVLRADGCAWRRAASQRAVLGSNDARRARQLLLVGHQDADLFSGRVEAPTQRDEVHGSRGRRRQVRLRPRARFPLRVHVHDADGSPARRGVVSQDRPVRRSRGHRPAFQPGGTPSRRGRARQSRH